VLEMSTTPTPYSGLSAEVQSAMQDLQEDRDSYVPVKPAEELFRLEGVQIFFVTPEGRVSTFSAPETLRLFQFDEGEITEGEPATFLQVGGWTHPLVKGASPCLEAENGALMFPDMYSEVAGASVGLVLSEHVSQEQRDQLISVLGQHTALKSHNLLPPDQQLGAVGSALVKGAELVSQGIELGAGKAGELIEYMTEAGQARLARAEEDAKVGSLTKHSIQAAKSATGATVKVSGYVADRVGKLTKRLASSLANKVVDPNSNTAVDQSQKRKSSSMALLADAARGGLIAYGTVYNGLETSAKVLGEKVKENSVRVVNHKYGLQAGEAFGDACTAAGNAALTYMNIQSLGAKGLVKKTAKETGKSVAKNVVHKTAGVPQQETA